MMAIMPVKTLLMMLVMMLISITARAGTDAPDAELLEFLADWETTDGQWVEPSSLEDLDSEAMKQNNDLMQNRQEEQDAQ